MTLSRYARRAYVFDESAVERDEGGRFTFKDGGRTGPEPKDIEERHDWPDPTTQVREAVDRIGAALPGVQIRVHPEITDRAGTERDSRITYIKAQDYADAVNGVASGFERMAADYPEVASRIGTIELGPTDSGRGLGQYLHQGSGQKYEGLAPPGAYAGQPRPLIQIDIDGLVEAHARAYRQPGVEIQTHTVPSERANLNIERLTEGVATHEWGHAVYYAAPSPVVMHATADRAFQAGQYDAHISDYAGENHHEYFAEAFTANELGLGDRLTDADRNMLVQAGVDVAPRAAAAPEIEDPPPDTFEGSIIWEYAEEREAEQASVSRFVRRAYVFDEASVVRDEGGRFSTKGGGGASRDQDLEDTLAHQRDPAHWTDNTREVNPSPKQHAAERYSVATFVESRLSAAFPNAEVTGVQGWREIVDEAQLELIGNVEPDTPEWDAAVAASEAAGDRVVAVYDGLEQMAGQFPLVAGSVTSIELVPGELEGGGEANTLIGPGRVDIKFSLASLLGTDDASSFTVAKRDASDTGDTRRWAFGNALHEFGHVVDAHAAAVEHGAALTSDDFMAFKHNEPGAPPPLAAWEKDFPDHFDVSSGEVSWYAATEPAEYAAEAFALSRLDPGALHEDARDIVEWIEERAAEQPGVDVADLMTASTEPTTLPDGTPGVLIVDMFTDDCVSTRFAFDMLRSPITAAIAGPAEIIREIPDKFVTDDEEDEDERVRRAYVFDESNVERDEGGRFTTSGDGASGDDALSADETGASGTADLDEAVEVWTGDMSMEITDQAVKLAGEPSGWSSSGSRSNPELAGYASTLMDAVDAAAPAGVPLYSGHGALHSPDFKVGDEFVIPLMSASPERAMAEGFPNPVGHQRGDEVVYTFDGATPTLNEAGGPRTVVISGTFRVDEIGDRAVAFSYVGPAPRARSASSRFTRRAAFDESRCADENRKPRRAYVFDESAVTRDSSGRFARQEGGDEITDEEAENPDVYGPVESPVLSTPTERAIGLRDAINEIEHGEFGTYVERPLPEGDRVQEWRIIGVSTGPVTTEPGEQPLIRVEMSRDLDGGGTETEYRDYAVPLDRFQADGSIGRLTLADVIENADREAREQSDRIRELLDAHETEARGQSEGWDAVHTLLREDPRWFEPMDITGHEGGTFRAVGTTTQDDGTRGLVVAVEQDGHRLEDVFVPLADRHVNVRDEIDRATLAVDMMDAARARIDPSYMDGGSRYDIVRPESEYLDRFERIDADLGGSLPEGVTGDLRYGDESATYNIEHENGGHGVVTFDFPRHDVLHVDLMQFSSDMQGEGVATAVVGGLITSAEDMGIREVQFQANISVGGYAWARMGAYPTEESWESLQADIGARLNMATEAGIHIDPDAKADLDRLLEGSRTGLPDIAALDTKITLDEETRRFFPSNIRTDENNQIELGKALLLGTSWNAALPIGDQSAREDFSQYEREKQAEEATREALAAAAGPPHGIGAFVRSDGSLDDESFWAEVLDDATLAPPRFAGVSRFARRASFNEDDHPRDDSGRFSSKDGGGGEKRSRDYAVKDKIPDKPGSTKIPDGHVRMYHYTKIPEDERPLDERVHEAAESLRTGGIKISKAQGETYGEPNGVWASAEMPSPEDHVFVEFSVPLGDPRWVVGAPLEISPDSTYEGKYIAPDGRAYNSSPADIERRGSNVAFSGDIKPDEIIAVHEPWHTAVRYFDDDPTLKEGVREGEFDHLLDDPRYGPAIRRMQASIGTRLASPIGTRLASPIGTRLASRFARRAYTFDESSVVRDESGRFSTKDGGEAAPGKATAAEYGLNYQEEYVNDPDVLAAKKWDGWDGVPTTEVDPKSLVAVEDELSRASIDKVVNGDEPLREGYTVHVVRLDDGTEVIVDGHHRAAMAAEMDRPLEVQIADAREIRGEEPEERVEFVRETRAAAEEWAGSKARTDAIQDAADALMTGRPAEGEAAAHAAAMMRAVADSPPNDDPLFRGVNGGPQRYTPGQDVAFSLGSFSEDETWASKFAAGLTREPSRLGAPILFQIETGNARALDFATLNREPTDAPAKINEKEWVTGGEFVVERVEPYTTGRGLPEGQRVVLRQTEVPHAANA